MGRVEGESASFNNPTFLCPHEHKRGVLADIHTRSVIAIFSGWIRLSANWQSTCFHSPSPSKFIRNKVIVHCALNTSKLLMFASLISISVVCSSTLANHICKITLPIGLWLKNNNNSNPCDTVEGHFILDETANNFTDELFSHFYNLRRIEGCLYAKGFTGSLNLSFFFNLEEVVCQREDASLIGLSNVIFVMEPSLERMGLNSLKRVEGPGQVVLSYEEVQQPYSQFNSILPDGVHCFSKQEMLFLARHSQFNGKLYQPCETDDPCFSLNYHKRFTTILEGEKINYWHYTVADIPENCTTFVGVICINGPYDNNNGLFEKFSNLTLLIGQIHMMGTFFDRLDMIFPKLEEIYPYELPTIYSGGPLTCNDITVPDAFYHSYFVTKQDKALQPVRVRLNRFLTNMSLPSLRPTRPIDVSNPKFILSIPSNWFNYATYFPDTIQSPCKHFPQFEPKNCGRFIHNGTYPYEFSDNPLDDFIELTWAVAMVLTTIGVIFSLRTIILLQFSSSVSTCLPYSRYFIVISLLISTLAAIESCIIYQKFNSLLYDYRDAPVLLSEFTSPHLAHPLFQFVMLTIISCKQICLALIIFCYLDLAVFYRFRSLKVSLSFCTLITVLAAMLTGYFYSQLVVVIRGKKPTYSREPRDVIYIPFVINVANVVNFNQFLPSTKYITVVFEALDLFNPEITDYLDIELHGKIFPSFVDICDASMLLVSLLFHLLVLLEFIKPHNSFIVLIFLYLQLSANRLRYYLYDLMVNDYCLREDTWSGEDNTYSLHFNCYFTYLIIGERTEPIMEKNTWKVIKKIIEKLPYASYSIVSWVCWRFARYESYLGPALRHRETKIEWMNSNSQGTFENPSDFTLSS